MTEMIFIRHAETNLYGRFCGHTDPPVNLRGKEQVRSLRLALADSSMDRVVSSDLQRATQTAAELAEAWNLSLITCPTLREISFGDWEALSWDEIEARDAAVAKHWLESFPQSAAPGGERFDAFRERVLGAVRSIEMEAQGERVAVVTHGGVMRVVLQDLMGVPSDRAWQMTKPYCSVFTYRSNSPADSGRR
jgi:broad specificity phosphatase PhoE